MECPEGKLNPDTSAKRSTSGRGRWITNFFAWFKITTSPKFATLNQPGRLTGTNTALRHRLVILAAIASHPLEKTADLVSGIFSRNKPKRYVDLGVRYGNANAVLAKVAITALDAHVGGKARQR